MLPAILGISGWVYLVGALLLTGWQIWATGAVARDHTPLRARRLFLATVFYLPALLGLMVVDKIG